MSARAQGPDSIAFQYGQDTLWLKRSYSVSVPEYISAADSSWIKQLPQANTAQQTTGLVAKGSISRGIQVSTNASVSLQSSMYLRIDGALSENYQVTGTLSEKTSPLQPIGNTRRLNDFDRVLISVTGPSLRTDIGDIDLKLENGRFGRLTRNIEGLHFQGQRQPYGVDLGLGFSYGKTQLLQIQGKDGKQGPYRLSGSNGEKYIIVLAGSEEVLLDGEVMQRGAEDDYIIDYNAAEIHFTQGHLLSANSRISVKFEYVPDIYLSSYTFGKQVMAAQADFGHKAETPAYLSVSWQELRDDRKNPLGNVQRAELELIFEDLEPTTGSLWVDAIVADSLGGDYLLNASDHLEYVGPGNGTSRVQFSFVGLSQGAYRKVISNDVSYFVYDSLNGEYLPAQKYIAPGTHGIAALSGGAAWGPLVISGDLGLSRRVNNLYSRSQDPLYHPAWELQGGLESRPASLIIGDKYYAEGFQGHDPLESLEYYRKWQLRPRIAEAERLQSVAVRLGQNDGAQLLTGLTRLNRSDQRQGEQLVLKAQTDVDRDNWVSLNSAVTLLDSLTRNEHELLGRVNVGRLTSTGHLALEEGRFSIYYPSNDHLEYGLGLDYPVGERQELELALSRRQDYRFQEAGRSILSMEDVGNWASLRRDYGFGYRFRELLHSQGMIKLKYRHQESDSTGSNQYFLGQAKITSRFLDERVVIQEELLIDEEHIPRYDYHYVAVDTGYGEFSYDPLLSDFIPVSGGRYIRQRLYSDIEEQVRKYENQTHLQITSRGFRDPLKKGAKLSLRQELFSQLRVNTNDEVQGRSLTMAELTFKNDNRGSLEKVTYQFRENRSNSALYSFGDESSRLRLNALETSFKWDKRSASLAGLEWEQRSRDIEYNALAREDWQAVRPSLEHSYKLTDYQLITASYRYSAVVDHATAHDFSEHFLKFQHELRFARRGRLTQELEGAQITADVAGIPYSIFAGRQPGQNWKYGLNGRYVFSSRFQVMLNYSIRQRGAGRSEQFLRVEGRTQF